MHMETVCEVTDQSTWKKNNNHHQTWAQPGIQKEEPRSNTVLLSKGRYIHTKLSQHPRQDIPFSRKVEEQQMNTKEGKTFGQQNMLYALCLGFSLLDRKSVVQGKRGFPGVVLVRRRIKNKKHCPRHIHESCSIVIWSWYYWDHV